MVTHRQVGIKIAPSQMSCTMDSPIKLGTEGSNYCLKNIFKMGLCKLSQQDNNEQFCSDLWLWAEPFSTKVNNKLSKTGRAFSGRLVRQSGRARSDPSRPPKIDLTHLSSGPHPSLCFPFGFLPNLFFAHSPSEAKDTAISSIQWAPWLLLLPCMPSPSPPLLPFIPEGLQLSAPSSEIGGDPDLFLGLWDAWSLLPRLHLLSRPLPRCPGLSWSFHPWERFPLWPMKVGLLVQASDLLWTNWAPPSCAWTPRTGSLSWTRSLAFMFRFSRAYLLIFVTCLLLL